MESWLLSTDSQVITPSPHFFWQLQSLAHSHSLHTTYILTLGDLNICIYDSFTAWLLTTLMSFLPMILLSTLLQPPHSPSQTVDLVKIVTCNPAIIPFHSDHHLSSFQLIFSTLTAGSNDLWLFISNQLIILSYHYFSWFNIFSFFLSSLKLQGQCL